MNERFERVKEHIKKHKATYSFVAGGVLFASFTAILMRGKYSLGGYGYNQREDQLMDIGSLQANASPLKQLSSDWFSSQGEEAVGLPAKPQAIVSSVLSNSLNTTINVNERVNPLSYIIREDGTDRWWISQADLARERGYYEGDISKHLNWGKPLHDGTSYSRMGIAS